MENLIWVCEDGVIGNEMRTTPSEALCACKASEKTEEGCLWETAVHQHFIVKASVRDRIKSAWPGQNSKFVPRF